jgi:hypothetical protein
VTRFRDFGANVGNVDHKSPQQQQKQLGIFPANFETNWER